MITEIDKKNINIIGVISDTHGLLRPEVKDVFKDVKLIIHAGDIGDAVIIKALEEIAPVIAVKGNIDQLSGFEELPVIRKMKIGAHNFTIVHNIIEYNQNHAGKRDVIIFGHSHKPGAEEKNGALFFNPGSAGKKRFSLPVSVGLLILEKNNIKPEIHYLDV